MLKIYHNTRCSKSRCTLDLLKEKGKDFEVVEYLKTPPTVAELQEITAKLNLKPEQLVRKGEKLYQEKFAGKTYTDEEWLRILAENPVLIERPIVVKGDKAVIGRPPENVLTIL
ncbi:arsenate reductase (glutaredoxin) [Adhaeribacter soli]|uniref:Arsenate reductase (Glutaredoxin) n=1 Tax=Adhaeribacter soli TaxID=2607655 RepID=A0A5N1J984_9BACT|nr:arsenate reductase (glutaredoxin) [Adhaeribacter soli]KAA9345538.1 arsenate reductase (glutaredoxin) [Adhaeribacter soli]